MENHVGPSEDSVLQNGSTTNFTSEANVSVGLYQSPSDYSNIFKGDLETYTQQDIIEFLKKPKAISTGTFTTTDTGILLNIDPYAFLITQAIYNNKISGHLGIRADVHVKLVLNATRFQQGRYCLAWFPEAGSDATTNQRTSWYNMHVGTLTNRTQLPHVEIDLNRDTECTMVVPYVSAYSHKIIKDTQFTSPGEILLFPYSALKAPSGSTVASYTIYVHYENVTLSGITQPQSNIKFRSKKVAASNNEQLVGGIGPITSTLNKISKASGVLAQIPLLSSVAAPVSWFTDILSSAANVFGWSSPLDLSEVTRAVQTIVPYSNNVDMPDGSMPISLYARNTIELLPGLGGTDIDEMAIDHIKTIPAFYKRFNLDTIDVVGTPVFTETLSYSNYGSTITDTGITVQAFTPLSYLAQFFTYVRGGLVFRFKIMSTEFHSGRYSLVFTPSEPIIGATATYAGSDYCHREIIDLRDGCEFTFHIPYTSIKPYRVVGSNESFGTLSLFPVNPLKAPSTVSQVVDVCVEVAGAPDVEYAGLRTNTWSVHSPSAPQSNVKFVSSVNEITSGDIGNSKLHDDNMLASRHCIGERLLSLNALLKHTDELIPVTQGTTARTAIIDPFYIQSSGVVAGVIETVPYRSDLYSMIVSMYAMSRGSVRWRVFNAGSTSVNSTERNNSVITYQSSGTILGITEITTALAPTRFGLKVTQNQIYRGCAEVQTPPYHDTYARTNCDMISAGVNLTIDKSRPSTSKMLLSVDTGTANGNIYRRQVADDFQCSQFISTPTLRAI